MEGFRSGRPRSRPDVLIQWRMEVLHEVLPILGVPTELIWKIAATIKQNCRWTYGDILPALPTQGRKSSAAAICSLSWDALTGQSKNVPTYLMNIYTRMQRLWTMHRNRIVRWLVEQARQRHISKIYLETSDKGRLPDQTIGFADMKDMIETVLWK